ncbi:MAG: hypothetical protein Q4C66_04185 [Lachnospiraceae bacterium]|nr:hypothetical protein [Lachnospiraceae bacterium]
MDENMIKKITPTHKVGIRIFSKTQLENVFPDYKNLLGKIETHRDRIQDIKLDDPEQGHYQYNLMYDNVFSILGKRGTGKTSVAFTLRNLIEEDEQHPYDIVMPIIIPEVIPSDCSVLGWMLAIVKQRVQEFENETNQNTFDLGNGACHDWSNCKAGIGGKSASLSQKVDNLIKTYFAGKYNPASESAFHLAVGNSSRQTQNYYEFSQMITSLWNDWITIIQKRQESQENGFSDPERRKRPLIYFIFDDVDLAPEKVSELLSIIIKYLSHPNVIVLTTADEEMFLEVIENNLDKNIGRLPKEWRLYLQPKAYGINSSQSFIKSKSDLISQTARLYLGKVMPTSTRYYLSLFSDVNRKLNFYMDDKNLGQAVNVLIEQFRSQICSSCQKCLNSADEDCKNCGGRKNFLWNDDRPIGFYFYFFGDTSRQIANTYFGIQKLIDSLLRALQAYQAGQLDISVYRNQIFYSFRHFFQLAISANHDLADDIERKEAFIDDIFLFEHNGWPMYIDYAFLEDFLKEKIQKKNGEDLKSILKIVMELYSLLLFAENIICLLENRKQVYGISLFTDFISKNVFHGMHLFRSNLDPNDFFAHYENLFDKISYMISYEQNPERFHVEYFHCLAHVSYQESELNLFSIYRLFKEDREWFAEMAELTTLVYSNLYLIGSNEAAVCSPYRADENLCRYQSAIYYLLQEGFRNCLDQPNLKEIAYDEISHLPIELDYSEGKHFDSFCRKIKRTLRKRRMQDIKEQVQAEHPDLDHGKVMEKVNNQYAKLQGNCPMTDLIQTIDTECREDTLANVLGKCPPYLFYNIRDRLYAGIGHKTDLALILKVLYETIEQWDYREHSLMIKDITKFLNASYQIGNIYESFSIYSSLADWAEMVSVDSDLLVDLMYREVKDELILIDDSCLRENISRDVVNRLHTLKKKMLQAFDATVNLEKANELEAAVIVGLSVQLAKRIQNIYLYQSIKEGFSHNYRMSSAGLQEIESPKEHPSKEHSLQTYYYGFYQIIQKLISESIIPEEIFVQIESQRKETLLEEDSAEKNIQTIAEELLQGLSLMKSYANRCASKGRNAYISQLLKGVQNESVSH